MDQKFVSQRVLIDSIISVNGFTMYDIALAYAVLAAMPEKEPASGKKAARAWLRVLNVSRS
jgi:hypothetical protein